MEKNILGTELVHCCFDPLTGFFRDGFCMTNTHDAGRHVICAEMTDAFLNHSKAQGNDLITPRAQADFPGLKAGDKWCLCALSWKEALQIGIAPPVHLASCHARALKYVSLEDLKAHAAKDTTSCELPESA